MKTPGMSIRSRVLHSGCRVWYPHKIASPKRGRGAGKGRPAHSLNGIRESSARNRSRLR